MFHTIIRLISHEKQAFKGLSFQQRNFRSWTFKRFSKRFSFTASGPSGTTGYAKVTIAKSLVSNITNIRVYLDNNQTEYSITSTDDSWLLTFNYTHSTHTVRVDLSTNLIPEFSNSLILFLLATLAVAVLVAKKRKLAKLHNNRRQTRGSKMDKLKVATLIIGIVLVVSGVFVSYYGTERQEETKTQGEFDFGTYIFYDYLTNKTYQGAGTASINDIMTRVDTVEILPVKTPDNFHGDINNFYYLVWDGGEKANTIGNKPTTIIAASELRARAPIYYTPSNSEVSFELVANSDNATWNSIVSSDVHFWYGTFVLHHTIPADYALSAFGVVNVIC